MTGNDQLEFVPIGPDTLPEAHRIYLHYVRNTTVTYHVRDLTAEQFAAMLAPASPRLGSWAIRRDGQTVGWCCLGAYKSRCAFDRTAEVSVYLDPDRTGQGIGTRAVEFLVATARARGLHALIASISGENTRSVRLFETMGFRTVGVLKEVGVKFGRRLDLVLCEKLLREEQLT
jgi:phosphinothricin acetyltransferase